MITDSDWESFHLDRTQSIWPPPDQRTDLSKKWRITITWRRVRAPRGEGHTYAAGVNIEGDGLPWDLPPGLEETRRDDQITRTPGRPPEVTSNLFVKRVRWGEVLREHRDQLEEKLRTRAAPFEGQVPPDTRNKKRAIAVRRAVASDLRELADDVAEDNTIRATPALYDLVLELLEEATKSHPSRSNVRVLELLQQRGYPLDPENPSDRVKVRRWCNTARKREADQR